MPHSESGPGDGTATPAAGSTPRGASPRKIGALGIRVERGVSYHGIALNVAPDLADFALIDPCGMPGVVSTSIAHELDPRDRTTARPDVVLAAGVFARSLGRALDSTLIGDPALINPTA